jgi:hypothetical protein
VRRRNSQQESHLSPLFISARPRDRVFVKNTTGSISLALTAVAAFLLVAALMAAMLRVAPRGHAGQTGAG